MKSSRKLFLVAIAHVIWSTLDDTCQYVPLIEPHTPTLMGSYQCRTSSPTARVARSLPELPAETWR